VGGNQRTCTGVDEGNEADRDKPASASASPRHSRLSSNVINPLMELICVLSGVNTEARTILCSRWIPTRAIIGMHRREDAYLSRWNTMLLHAAGHHHIRQSL
jgi:hypothetical protein